ncbi:hypothetical protein FWF74_00055 [Candidatus Saccharibacteria bacterium]|nr:hypothetical protein [Candidatus Saccharibacteria bacterium]MCL1963422.1 hypothetical protein [Candidatus Saccharibacteria bacterium]
MDNNFGLGQAGQASTPPPVAMSDDAATSSLGVFGNIIPNDTVVTSDQSTVDGIQAVEPIQSGPEFDFSGMTLTPQSEEAPAPVAAAPAPAPAPMPIPTKDTVKEDFIKTYTKEFDDMLQRATIAAQKILDSIDTVIREHASDIAIPAEANEFLDKPPTNNKVQKFDDARAIIEIIMARANEAKQNSEQAASEAARVYDEVQQFRNNTKEQISRLVS